MILTHKWTRNVPKLDRKWTQNRPKLDLKWTKNGPKWTKKRTKKGPKNGISCKKIQIFKCTKKFTFLSSWFFGQNMDFWSSVWLQFFNDPTFERTFLLTVQRNRGNGRKPLSFRSIHLPNLFFKFLMPF